MWLVVFVLMLFFSLQSFIFIEKNLKPPLMAVAEIRIKQIATQAINEAITEKVTNGAEFDKLVDWKTDNSGKVTGFMLNYMEHLKIASETEQVVEETLNSLQKVPEHIPLGQALDSAIIASFGPDIPIKFVPAGAAKIDLGTRQKDAGINMLLVEVYIRVTVEVKIIIPFDTKSQVLQTDIPISYMLVVGDVPMYYFDGSGNPVGENSSQAPPPSIALPPAEREQSQSNGQGKEAEETTVTIE